MDKKILKSSAKSAGIIISVFLVAGLGVLIVFDILLPFFQLIFITPGNCYPPSISGFVKMQPVVCVIDYRGRNFTANFTNVLRGFTANSTNVVGVNIILDSVVLNEINTGQACDVTTPQAGDIVKSGGVFTVSSVNCPAKEKGDKYNMSIIISYNATWDGITSYHTEKGYIKGDVGEL
jgi:hypothetical protein